MIDKNTNLLVENRDSKWIMCGINRDLFACRLLLDCRFSSVVFAVCLPSGIWKKCPYYGVSPSVCQCVTAYQVIQYLDLWAFSKEQIRWEGRADMLRMIINPFIQYLILNLLKIHLIHKQWYSPPDQIWLFITFDGSFFLVLCPHNQQMMGKLVWVWKKRRRTATEQFEIQNHLKNQLKPSCRHIDPQQAASLKSLEAIQSAELCFHQHHLWCRLLGTNCAGS